MATATKRKSAKKARPSGTAGKAAGGGSKAKRSHATAIWSKAKGWLLRRKWTPMSLTAKFREAGWAVVIDDRKEWLFEKMFRGVYVGASLSCIGFEVKEVTVENKLFRELLSGTGYRSYGDCDSVAAFAARIEADIMESLKKRGKRSDIPENIEQEIHDRWCPKNKDATAPVIAVRQRAIGRAKHIGGDPASVARALARRSDPKSSILNPASSTSIVDVAVVGSLDAAERRQLATLEKAIEKNAAAVFEFGNALRAIRDGRLYRATHSSFEQYLTDRWGISKSYGHRQIAAAAKYAEAAPIAARFGITLTCESQMRPLADVSAEDLPHVFKRASGLVAKAADGTRRVTEEILSRAVKYETLPPADLKREEDLKREASRQKAEGSRQIAAAPQDSSLKPQASSPDALIPHPQSQIPPPSVNSVPVTVPETWMKGQMVGVNAEDVVERVEELLTFVLQRSSFLGNAPLHRIMGRLLAAVDEIENHLEGTPRPPKETTRPKRSTMPPIATEGMFARNPK